MFKALKDTMLGRSRRPTPRPGEAAESLAADFLTARGARLLARNYRCRGGELDLVALHDGYLLLVEVRLRQRRDFGGAAASITPRKQQRLILAARHFLAAHPQWQHLPCRFDALLLESLQAERIEWLPDAFQADDV